jgi:hypothetical protein
MKEFVYNLKHEHQLKYYNKFYKYKGLKFEDEDDIERKKRKIIEKKLAE